LRDKSDRFQAAEANRVLHSEEQFEKLADCGEAQEMKRLVSPAQ
jgi:hypothetical protein